MSLTSNYKVGTYARGRGFCMLPDDPEIQARSKSVAAAELFETIRTSDSKKAIVPDLCHQEAAKRNKKP
jgi:hypothetical protein